jgi:hypothetical protein
MLLIQAIDLDGRSVVPMARAVLSQALARVRLMEEGNHRCCLMGKRPTTTVLCASLYMLPRRPLLPSSFSVDMILASKAQQLSMAMEIF